MKKYICSVLECSCVTVYKTHLHTPTHTYPHLHRASSPVSQWYTDKDHSLGGSANEHVYTHMTHFLQKCFAWFVRPDVTLTPDSLPGPSEMFLQSTNFSPDATFFYLCYCIWVFLIQMCIIILFLLNLMLLLFPFRYRLDLSACSWG